MPQGFDDIPVRDEQNTSAAFKDIPIIDKDKIQTNPKGTATPTQTTQNDFTESLRDRGKELGRESIRLAGTALPVILRTAASSLQAEGERGKKFQSTSALFPKQKLPTPIEDFQIDVGRRLTEAADKGIDKVNEFVNSIEALQPSERAQRISQEPFTRENFIEKAGQLGTQAVPSLIAAVGASIATNNPGTGALLLGAVEGGMAGREAEEAGASIETQAFVSQLSTIGIAMLEKLPLDEFLNGKVAAKLFKGTGKKTFIQGMKQALGKGAISFVGEGGQEATQTLFSNVVAKWGFDNTRGYLDGVLESAVGGALAGGITGGSLSVSESMRAKAKEAGVTEKELDQIDAVVGSAIASNSEEIAESAKNIVESSKEQVKAREALPQAEKDDINVQDAAISADEVALSLNDISRQALREVAIRSKEDIIRGDIRSKRQLEIEQRTGVKQVKEEPTITEREALKTLFRKQQQLSREIERTKNAEKRESLRKQRKDIEEVFKLRSKIRKAPRGKLTAEGRQELQDVVKAVRNVGNLEELRQIEDEVTKIKTKARDEALLLEDARKEYLDVQIDVMLAQKDIINKTEPKSTKSLNIPFRRTGDKKATELFFSTIRPSRLVNRFIDGGKNFLGAGHRFFIDSVNDQVNKQITEEEKAFEKGLAILKSVGLTPDKLTELFTIKDPVTGQSVQLTKSSIMEMWVVRGTKEHSTAIMFDNNINSRMYRDAVRNLSKSERIAADAMGKELSSHSPRVNEAYMDINDGQKTIYVVNGVYVPMLREIETTTNFNDLLTNEFEMRQAFNSGTVPKAFTKARSEGHTGRLLQMGLVEKYFDHVQRREQFINMAPHVRDMVTVLKDERFRDNMKEKQGGDEFLNQLDMYIKAVADPRIFKSTNQITKTLSMLRNNAAMAFLPFNLVTTAKQLPSYFLSLKELGDPRVLLAGTLDVAQNWDTIRPLVEELAPQMKRRSIAVELDEFQRLNPEAFDRGIQRLGKTGMELIFIADRAVTTSMWWSRYNQLLADPEVSVEEAAKEATNMVLRTQPASGAKDLPAILRNENIGILGQFQSQLNNIWNILVADIPADLQQGTIEGQKRAMVSLTTVGLSVYMIASIALGRAINPLDEDEVQNLIPFVISIIPIVGPLLSSQAQGFEGAGIPALEVFSKSGDVYDQVLNKGNLGKALQSATEAVALAKGVPVSAFLKAAKGTAEITIGDLQKADLPTKVQAIVQGPFTATRNTPKGRRKDKKKRERAAKKRDKQLSKALKFLGL